MTFNFYGSSRLPGMPQEAAGNYFQSGLAGSTSDRSGDVGQPTGMPSFFNPVSLSSSMTQSQSFQWQANNVWPILNPSHVFLPPVPVVGSPSPGLIPTVPPSTSPAVGTALSVPGSLNNPTVEKSGVSSSLDLPPVKPPRESRANLWKGILAAAASKPKSSFTDSTLPATAGTSGSGYSDNIEYDLLSDPVKQFVALCAPFQQASSYTAISLMNRFYFMASYHTRNNMQSVNESLLDRFQQGNVAFRYSQEMVDVGSQPVRVWLLNFAGTRIKGVGATTPDALTEAMILLVDEIQKFPELHEAAKNADDHAPANDYNRANNAPGAFASTEKAVAPHLNSVSVPPVAAPKSVMNKVDVSISALESIMKSIKERERPNTNAFGPRGQTGSTLDRLSLLTSMAAVSSASASTIASSSQSQARVQSKSDILANLAAIVSGSHSKRTPASLPPVEKSLSQRSDADVLSTLAAFVSGSKAKAVEAAPLPRVRSPHRRSDSADVFASLAAIVSGSRARAAPTASISPPLRKPPAQRSVAEMIADLKKIPLRSSKADVDRSPTDGTQDLLGRVREVFGISAEAVPKQPAAPETKVTKSEHAEDPVAQLLDLLSKGKSRSDDLIVKDNKRKWSPSSSSQSGSLSPSDKVLSDEKRQKRDCSRRDREMTRPKSRSRKSPSRERSPRRPRSRRNDNRRRTRSRSRHRSLPRRRSRSRLRRSHSPSHSRRARRSRSREMPDYRRCLSDRAKDTSSTRPGTSRLSKIPSLLSLGKPGNQPKAGKRSEDDNKTSSSKTAVRENSTLQQPFRDSKCKQAPDISKNLEAIDSSEDEYDDFLSSHSRVQSSSRSHKPIKINIGGVQKTSTPKQTPSRNWQQKTGGSPRDYGISSNFSDSDEAYDPARPLSVELNLSAGPKSPTAEEAASLEGELIASLRQFDRTGTQEGSGHDSGQKKSHDVFSHDGGNSSRQPNRCAGGSSLLTDPLTGDPLFEVGIVDDRIEIDREIVISVDPKHNSRRVIVEEVNSKPESSIDRLSALIESDRGAPGRSEYIESGRFGSKSRNSGGTGSGKSSRTGFIKEDGKEDVNHFREPKRRSVFDRLGTAPVFSEPSQPLRESEAPRNSRLSRVALEQLFCQRVAPLIRSGNRSETVDMVMSFCNVYKPDFSLENMHDVRTKERISVIKIFDEIAEGRGLDRPEAVFQAAGKMVEYTT